MAALLHFTLQTRQLLAYCYWPRAQLEATHVSMLMYLNTWVVLPWLLQNPVLPLNLDSKHCNSLPHLCHQSMPQGMQSRPAPQALSQGMKKEYPALSKCISKMQNWWLPANVLEYWTWLCKESEGSSSLLLRRRRMAAIASAPLTRATFASSDKLCSVTSSAAWCALWTCRVTSCASW